VRKAAMQEVNEYAFERFTAAEHQKPSEGKVSAGQVLFLLVVIPLMLLLVVILMASAHAGWRSEVKP
jgi:hypothetical protein